MNTVQLILVPLDFSEHAARALQLAADLAQHYQAELRLLHVIATPAYTLPDGTMIPGPELLDILFSAGAELLSKSKARALAAGAPRVETVMLAGNAAQEILQLAGACRCDLIVLGTHGRGGLQRVVMGSVAERVLRLAPCPVLTVKAPENTVAYTQLLHQSTAPNASSAAK